MIVCLTEAFFYGSYLVFLTGYTCLFSFQSTNAAADAVQK